MLRVDLWHGLGLLRALGIAHRHQRDDGRRCASSCGKSGSRVRQSAYGHRATLLHYRAANRIETRRQVVPTNAAEVIAALLDAGADRSAKLHAYGGEFDVLAMFKTSAHPHDAGVAAEVEHALAVN